MSFLLSRIHDAVTPGRVACVTGALAVLCAVATPLGVFDVTDLVAWALRYAGGIVLVCALAGVTVGLALMEDYD